MSHSGLLFKLKSIGVCGSVLSISTDFLSNRRQRVVVDGAASEWIPIISGMPQGVCWVLSIYSIYQRNVWAGWEQIICQCMQMTPHYWQLYASQQTDQLLLPSLRGSWRFARGKIGIVWKLQLLLILIEDAVRSIYKKQVITVKIEPVAFIWMFVCEMNFWATRNDKK